MMVFPPLNNRHRATTHGGTQHAQRNPVNELIKIHLTQFNPWYWDIEYNGEQKASAVCFTVVCYSKTKNAEKKKKTQRDLEQFQWIIAKKKKTLHINNIVILLMEIIYSVCGNIYIDLKHIYSRDVINLENKPINNLAFVTTTTTETHECERRCTDAAIIYWFRAKHIKARLRIEFEKYYIITLY